MMKKTFIIISTALAAMTAGAATPTVINLWEEGMMPYDNHVTAPEETDSRGFIKNVAVPTLTIYTPANFGVRPEANAGVAVLACPGGGYTIESPNAATDLADWYNSMGITYGVLKYRMPNGGYYEATMADVDQAMRLMRKFAGENSISTVGIQGASAGGHLASVQATHYTDSVSRPDFQILFYPVITLDPTYTHKGTHDKFLGKNPAKGLQEKYSNHTQVTPDTPPAIILGCYDDKVVPIKNSIDYFSALLDCKVPATLLIYPEGDHGWGHIHAIKYRRQWHDDLEAWLKNEVIDRIKK